MPPIGRPQRPPEHLAHEDTPAYLRIRGATIVSIAREAWEARQAYLQVANHGPLGSQRAGDQLSRALHALKLALETAKPGPGMKLVRVDYGRGDAQAWMFRGDGVWPTLLAILQEGEDEPLLYAVEHLSMEVPIEAVDLEH